jgi:hypothetical protein
MRTFANLRAEGDVLRGGAFDLLLGRHLELSVAGLRHEVLKEMVTVV